MFPAGGGEKDGSWPLEGTKDFKSRKEIQAGKVLQNVLTILKEIFEEQNQKTIVTISPVSVIMAASILDYMWWNLQLEC